MKKIIFACVHNAGRSQMAAALFNKLANNKKAHAISAGTEPATRVHPEVISVMKELEIDLSSAVPTRLTEALARQADLLVTMGCGEKCPYVPNLKIIEWQLEDPKGKSIAHVKEIRNQILKLVENLLSEF